MTTPPDPKQPSPTPQPFPPLEVPPDVDANYSNLVRISHSVAEIVLDFARILPYQGSMPGQGAPRVTARILMSPIGAKLFYKALGDNLARYEATFGAITLPGDSSLATDLFKQIHPPEPPKE